MALNSTESSCQGKTLETYLTFISPDSNYLKALALSQKYIQYLFCLLHFLCNNPSPNHDYLSTDYKQLPLSLSGGRKMSFKEIRA